MNQSLRYLCKQVSQALIFRMVKWVYKLFLWYNRMMYSIEEDEK